VTDSGGFFVIPNGEEAAQPPAVVSFQARFRRAIRAKLATELFKKRTIRSRARVQYRRFNIKDDKRTSQLLCVSGSFYFPRHNIKC
jgi:hypothetical protein